MISSTKPFKTTEQLENIINNSKALVYVEGKYLMQPDKEYKDDIHELPYGQSIVVMSGDDRYLFKRRTNNTIGVWKDGERNV